MSEHKPEAHAPAPAHAAEPEAGAPAKLPLLKRLLIGLASISLPMVVGAVLVATVLTVLGFAGGLMLGVRKGHAAEEILRVQIKNQLGQINKLREENAGLEKHLDEVKTLSEAQQADLKIAQDTAARLQLEKDTLDKILNEIKDKLMSGAPGKTPEKPGGFKLKFSDKECDPKNRTVTSKNDIGCMDLKNAIDSMNEAYSGKKPEAGGKKPEAPAKPAESKHTESKHH